MSNIKPYYGFFVDRIEILNDFDRNVHGIIQLFQNYSNYKTRKPEIKIFTLTTPKSIPPYLKNKIIDLSEKDDDEIFDILYEHKCDIIHALVHYTKTDILIQAKEYLDFKLVYYLTELSVLSENFNEVNANDLYDYIPEYDYIIKHKNFLKNNPAFETKKMIELLDDVPNSVMNLLPNDQLVTPFLKKNNRKYLKFSREQRNEFRSMINLEDSMPLHLWYGYNHFYYNLSSFIEILQAKPDHVPFHYLIVIPPSDIEPQQIEIPDGLPSDTGIATRFEEVDFSKHSGWVVQLKENLELPELQKLYSAVDYMHNTSSMFTDYNRIMEAFVYNVQVIIPKITYKHDLTNFGIFHLYYTNTSILMNTSSTFELIKPVFHGNVIPIMNSYKKKYNSNIFEHFHQDHKEDYQSGNYYKFREKEIFNIPDFNSYTHIPLIQLIEGYTLSCIF